MLFLFPLGACFSYYSSCSSRNVLSQLWHIGTRWAYYQSWSRKHWVSCTCPRGVSNLFLWSLDIFQMLMLVIGVRKWFYFKLTYLCWHMLIYMQSSSFRFPFLYLDEEKIICILLLLFFLIWVKRGADLH